MDASALANENALVLGLVQALLGAVSPNMRAVTLSANGRDVRLRFYLERDTPEDREEAEDVGAELEALQDGPLDSLQIDIIVGSEQWPLGVGSLSGRAVYVRGGM